MFRALLTAAAPPPTTITDPAAASRSCASRRSAPISAADCRVGRRQKPLLTPVQMTSASYGSATGAPSSPRPNTVRAARSTPVSVACTVRTPSRRRNRSNGIQ